MALNATFLMAQRPAAIRAHSYDIHLFIKVGSLELVIMRMFHRNRYCLCYLNLRLDIDQPALDYPGDRVGAGEYTLTLFPGRRRATDVT